jgi:hypothetical protein
MKFAEMGALHMAKSRQNKQHLLKKGMTVLMDNYYNFSYKAKDLKIQHHTHT